MKHRYYPIIIVSFALLTPYTYAMQQDSLRITDTAGNFIFELPIKAFLAKPTVARPILSKPTLAPRPSATRPFTGQFTPTLPAAPKPPIVHPVAPIAVITPKPKPAPKPSPPLKPAKTPEAPVIIEPYNQSNITNYNPMFRGTSEPETQVAIFIDNTLSGTTQADSHGAWLFNQPKALSCGFHVFQATATRQDKTSITCEPVLCTITPPLTILFLDAIPAPYDIYSLTLLGSLNAHIIFNNYLTFSSNGIELYTQNGMTTHGTELLELALSLTPTRIGFTLGGPADLANQKIASMGQKERDSLTNSILQLMSNSPEYSCMCIDFKDTPKSLQAAEQVADYIHTLAHAIKQIDPYFVIALTVGNPIENMRIFSTKRYQQLLQATYEHEGITLPLISYVIVQAIDFDKTDRTQNPFNGNVTSASIKQPIKTRLLWPDYQQEIDWSATGIINYLLNDAQVPQSKLIIQLTSHVNLPSGARQAWCQLPEKTKAVLASPPLLDTYAQEVLLGNAPISAAYTPPQAITEKIKFYIKKLNFNKNRLSGMAFSIIDDPHNELEIINLSDIKKETT